MNPQWIESLPKTPPETETEHHSEQEETISTLNTLNTFSMNEDDYIYNDDFYESDDDHDNDEYSYESITDIYDIINMETPIDIKLNRREMEHFHSKLYRYYASTRCCQQSCSDRYEMLCLMNSIWQKVLISREVDKNSGNIIIIEEIKHNIIKPYNKTPCFAPKKRLKLISNDNESVIYNKIIPSASIFGSICTGLECEGSDLDITLPNSVDNPCIDIWFNKNEQKSKLSTFLTRLNEEINENKFKYKFQVFPVLNAKVPIIKIRELSLKLEMDIAIQSTQQPVANLINAYCDYDERVRPFIIAIKHWSKARAICDAMNNYPNSFGFVLLCIKYLQMVHIVPIYCINNNDEIKMVHNIDINIINNDTLLQLMVQFFEMYHRFNFKLLQISTSRSGLESKICHEFYSNFKYNHQTTMVVEDPSCRCVNVTRHVRPYRLNIMQNEFFRAYVCCKNGDWDLLMTTYLNSNTDISVFNKYPPQDNEQLFYQTKMTKNVLRTFI